MDVIIKKELDPLFETLNLLAYCHADDWRQQTIQELTDYGIDGTAFFQKHLKIVEKYVSTFQKHKVTSQQEDFFFDNTEKDTFLMLITMAVENRHYLNDPSAINPMQLRSLLAYYIIDMGDRAHLPDIADMPQLPDEKAMVEFLDTTDIKNEEKWYILGLLRKPDCWLKQLMEIVRDNIPAYEAAKAAVAKPLEKLLNRDVARKDKEFLKLAETCSNKPVIYPSLALSMAQIILYTHGYYGLFDEELTTYEASANAAKETLIRQTKLLSDKSKLDILCSLRHSNKYNLELAETLGLSPSTTSHHMNALLSQGFVTVEKRDGKVYYCLHKENIQSFLDTLTQMLI